MERRGKNLDSFRAVPFYGCVPKIYFSRFYRIEAGITKQLPIILNFSELKFSVFKIKQRQCYNRKTNFTGGEKSPRIKGD